MTTEAAEAAEVENDDSARPSSPERTHAGSEDRPADATSPEETEEAREPQDAREAGETPSEETDTSLEGPAEPSSETLGGDDPSATAVFRIPVRKTPPSAPGPREEAPEGDDSPEGRVPRPDSPEASETDGARESRGEADPAESEETSDDREAPGDRDAAESAEDPEDPETADAGETPGGRDAPEGAEDTGDPETAGDRDAAESAEGSGGGNAPGEPDALEAAEGSGDPDAPEDPDAPDDDTSILAVSVIDVSVVDASASGLSGLSGTEGSLVDASVTDASIEDTSVIDVSGIVRDLGKAKDEEVKDEETETDEEAASDGAETTAELRLPSPSRVPAAQPPAASALSPSGVSAVPEAVAASAPASVPPSGPQARTERISWTERLARTSGAWLPPLLTVEGLIMYVLALRVAPGPLRGVDLSHIDGLGLISALPVTAFAAIALMITAFFVTIAQNTDRKFLLLFQIAAITFALHGAAALIEDTPRFHTAYVHAGFVEFINRTGTSSPILDARFAWPGFFALVAFVTKAAGVTDLTMILRWTPLLSNLLYLLPFVLILRQVVATTRARWFAALLFVIVQWIGQDYFSPQGFTYAIYLAFVAIVLRWFGKVEPREEGAPPKGRIRRLLARLDGLTPGELTHSTGVYDRSIMLIVLITLFGTATASHQITPFMMLGALTGLILLRRSSLSWGLPFLLGLIVLAWISYQTVTFWSGHIDQLFGGLGRILENLQSNTGDRIEGSDSRHALVLMTRLGICAAILLLAAVGLLRRLRRGVGDRAALLLLCVPVLALGLQSYGGEIGLRIYLFALPGACILAAYAFFPNLPAGTAEAPEETVPIRRRNIRFDPRLTRRISLLLAAGCALALSMAFLVARYGNEQFERVSSGEVAAMHYVYQHDEPSGRVLYLVPIIGPEVTPTIPWGEQDLGKIAYEQVLVDKNPAQLSSVIDKFRVSPPNTYLVASRGQAAYLQLNHGYPADWEQRFRAALDSSKELKRVFTSDAAAVYTLRNYPKGAEIPEPQPLSGLGDRGSPMTPIGLGALGVTWISLFAYELYRLRGLDQSAKARRRILFVAVPAFLLAVAVIVERFIVIGFSQLQ
ncbi:hypothetical protein [Streptosporangium carneum]|uniref:Uncharacterized protein n=1 Tax=Streptosporangium carneum TaxID=47481 RepID=A0A9W6I7H1_9ACTN|nr:hypothetical protein [Streptosporangium carneum]GLK13532.1 hypothetical protein GCM10017600_69430 [Streptosporangium carneum]